MKSKHFYITNDYSKSEPVYVNMSGKEESTKIEVIIDGKSVRKQPWEICKPALNEK